MWPTRKVRRRSMNEDLDETIHSGVFVGNVTSLDFDKNQISFEKYINLYTLIIW